MIKFCFEQKQLWRTARRMVESSIKQRNLEILEMKIKERL